MRFLFWMTLLAVNASILVPSTKSQPILGTDSVRFDGKLIDPNQDTCSFNGSDIGELGFDVASSTIESIKPAEVGASIAVSSTSTLSDFVIELSNPTIGIKKSGSSSYDDVNVNDQGIGVSQGISSTPPIPTLGQSTLRITPQAENTPLLVSTAFKTQDPIQEGDYQSTVSLACFVVLR